MSFADRLHELVNSRQSQIVLGIDPDPAALLPSALDAAGEGPPAERAGRAVAAHCRALIEAASPACVAVKLQSACFERLGAPGWQALADSTAAARAAGLMAIADVKRGDVPHTAAAYAQALVGSTDTPWGEVTGLGADAVTANPMLGRDSLEPLVSGCREAGAGLFVLVRTSNTGAAEFQDAGQPPLRERLAQTVSELGSDGIGECGLSDVGALVGATEPGLLERLRELMPQTILLLPGVGAQGGRIEDLAPAFAPGPAGGLIAASRSIAGPAVEAGDANAALAAAEGLRERAWKVASQQ